MRWPIAITLVFSLLVCSDFPTAAEAQERSVMVSPNQPMPDLSTLPEESEISNCSLVDALLLYIPNRILDFIDIFRADVGFGPSEGAVARVTKYGQAGSRSMDPSSLRIGLMGRRLPVMLETSNERGFGPSFKKSSQRKVCWGEIGAGLDLWIAGAYVGACPDELVDFAAGLLMFDLKDDDYISFE